MNTQDNGYMTCPACKTNDGNATIMVRKGIYMNRNLSESVTIWQCPACKNIECE